MDTPELVALCTRSAPGLPDPERAKEAASRVRTTTKKGKVAYRPDQRRASKTQAKDAATLARWLNARADLDDTVVTALPEEAHDAMSVLADRTSTKHLLGIIHVDTAGSGRLIFTVDATPRDPEWAGLSPYWELAEGTTAALVADPKEPNRPYCVLLHSPTATEVLMEGDAASDEIPEGFGQTIAAMLRHHGAVAVQWYESIDEDDDGGGEGPHTWASWHYDMPKGFPSQPEGWTLTQHIGHTWMLEQPNQAISMATYAKNNAEATVLMSEAATRRGVHDAATGAAIAARLMADRAQVCLNTAYGLSQQGALIYVPRTTVELLSDEINQLIKDAGRLPDRRNPGPHRWYADMAHRLLRHKSATVMLPALLGDIDPASGDLQRHHMLVSTLQQICTWPTENIYNVADYPVGSEPDPGLAAAVKACDEEMHTCLAMALATLNDRLGTQISPLLSKFPALEARLRGALLPITSCAGGFEYAELAAEAALDEIVPGIPRVNQDLEPLQPSSPADVASIGWAGFIWKNTRIFKGLAEAYPKGYPKEFVFQHHHLMQQRLASIIPDDPDAPWIPTIQPFATMLAAIEAAMNEDWHTIDVAAIGMLDDAASNQGLDNSETHRLLYAMAGSNISLMHYLRYNSDRASTSPDPENERPKAAPTLTGAQAEHLRTAAARAGFPQASCRRISQGRG